MQPFFFYSDTTQRNQPDELEVVREIFGEDNVSSSLLDIPAGAVVIPRFRAIPFGKELEGEVARMGSHLPSQQTRLINSYKEHLTVANLFNWVPLLDGLTAPAYHDYEVSHLPEGEWFVKGMTNSIKNRWFECCYAPTTKALPEVIRNNQLDTYVGSQEIVIRPFQRYRQIGVAVDNRPVFNERRCFIHKGEVLSYADYWSSLPEFKTDALSEDKFNETVVEAIARVGHLASFLVIDFAENEDGSWQVVELNDGCMSGLSENSPEQVWGSLAKKIRPGYYL